jgi:glutamine synthetase
MEDGYTEPDMILTPDMATASPAPWTADWTLQVIHDISARTAPVPFAPRNVLKRIVLALRSPGLAARGRAGDGVLTWSPQPDPGARSSRRWAARAGRAAARQAYSMSAVDEYGPVIDDIYDFAEAQGFEIDGITAGGRRGADRDQPAPWRPGALADQIFFFKRLIREAALRHDCFATFMAKPIEEEPGSAMHIHHSVIDRVSGRNIFAAEDGSETPQFAHFIGGLQAHLPSVIAVLAPYVNSYRRYVPDFAAPINLEWGRDNRTTGIRVPVSDPAARRAENRLAGMDCNPYLGIAASLACGYLGLVEGREPGPECTGDAYSEDEAIPRGLADALDLFRAAEPMRAVLGRQFCDVYHAVKSTENTGFLQVISPWEREHLLLNV